MWQAADKSTEKIIEFSPPLAMPGVPEKFEFRGVYLSKNERVGQWSAIYWRARRVGTERKESL